MTHDKVSEYHNILLDVVIALVKCIVNIAHSDSK